ncbi:MAG: hypothetical protein ACKVXR_05600 [Planctomycetota bacterium]
MSPSRILLLVFLVALASVAAALLSRTAGPRVPDRISATSSPEASPPLESSGGEAVSLQSAPPQGREEIRTRETDPPRPAPRHELVEVRGQVRRSGEPVVEFDLVFQPIGAGASPRDDDWDSTDDHGRYAVELRAATRYAVLHDDAGPQVAEFVVPAGSREFALDIHLLHGN